eukprot:413804-Amphidinium_carterae.1
MEARSCSHICTQDKQNLNTIWSKSQACGPEVAWNENKQAANRSSLLHAWTAASTDVQLATNDTRRTKPHNPKSTRQQARTHGYEPAR